MHCGFVSNCVEVGPTVGDRTPRNDDTCAPTELDQMETQCPIVVEVQDSAEEPAAIGRLCILAH